MAIVNGLEVPESNRTWSGLANTTTDVTAIKNGAERCYAGTVPWDIALKLVPALEGSHPDYGRFKIGLYDDPRKAAYAAAYFMANPPDNSTVQRYLANDRTSFNKYWSVPFPPDLFTEIPWSREEDQQRAGQLDRSQAARITRADAQGKATKSEMTRRDSIARDGFYKRYPGKDGFEILKGIMNYYDIGKDAMTRLLDTLTTNEFELRFGKRENNHDLSRFADPQYQQPKEHAKQNRDSLSESTQLLIANIEQEVLLESGLDRILSLSGIR